jgi:hypothetical protein
MYGVDGWMDQWVGRMSGWLDGGCRYIVTIDSFTCPTPTTCTCKQWMDVTPFCNDRTVQAAPSDTEAQRMLGVVDAKLLALDWGKKEEGKGRGCVCVWYCDLCVCVCVKERKGKGCVWHGDVW